MLKPLIIVQCDHKNRVVWRNNNLAMKLSRSQSYNASLRQRFLDSKIYVLNRKNHDFWVQLLGTVNLLDKTDVEPGIITKTKAVLL